jgi:hypothetical protein
MTRTLIIEEHHLPLPAEDVDVENVLAVMRQHGPGVRLTADDDNAIFSVVISDTTGDPTVGLGRAVTNINLAIRRLEDIQGALSPADQHHKAARDAVECLTSARAALHKEMPWLPQE